MCLQAVHLTAVRHSSSTIRETAYREEWRDTQGLTSTDVTLFIVRLLTLLVCGDSTLGNLDAVEALFGCPSERAN